MIRAQRHRECICRNELDMETVVWNAGQGVSPIPT